MEIESIQEVQKSVSNFLITLISGEIISLPCIKNENVREERDGYTSIDIESATYIQRLYEAFKNKELVQHILKKSINVDINEYPHIEINREFTYDAYFKINKFEMSSSVTDCGTYNITFETV